MSMLHVNISMLTENIKWFIYYFTNLPGFLMTVLFASCFLFTFFFFYFIFFLFLWLCRGHKLLSNLLGNQLGDRSRFPVCMLKRKVFVYYNLRIYIPYENSSNYKNRYMIWFSSIKIPHVRSFNVQFNRFYIHTCTHTHTNYCLSYPTKTEL